MHPKFYDPAEIKFVNNKFILATNDKNNPIQMVRQLEKDNVNKVLISLSNGESYQDNIESLQDLIAITSNEAWNVVFNFGFYLSIYEKENSTDEKTWETFNSIAKTLSNVQGDVRCFDTGKYIKENKMIPKRMAVTGSGFEFLSQNVTGDLRDIDRLRTFGDVGVTLICPRNIVEDIVKEIEQELESAFISITDGSLAPKGAGFRFQEVNAIIESMDLAEGIKYIKNSNNPIDEEILVRLESKEVYSFDYNNEKFFQVS